jgi:hypothetical protein
MMKAVQVALPHLMAFFSGSVQQTSNATSDAITLVMSGNSVAPAGFGPPGELVNGTSSLFSLQFTLTDPSQVHIFGGADLFLQAPSACSRPSCFSGSGTQMVALTGPGVNFAPSIPVLTLNSPAGQSVQQHVPFGSTFELLPGQYDLEVSSVISGVASGDFVNGPNVSFDLSLTADFTSIVPEPSAAPFLLLSIAGLVWYRARGRADSRNFPLGRRNGDSTRSL